MSNTWYYFSLPLTVCGGSSGPEPKDGPQLWPAVCMWQHAASEMCCPADLSWRDRDECFLLCFTAAAGQNLLWSVLHAVGTARPPWNSSIPPPWLWRETETKGHTRRTHADLWTRVQRSLNVELEQRHKMRFYHRNLQLKLFFCETEHTPEKNNFKC